MGISKYFILGLLGFVFGIFFADYFIFNLYIYIGTLTILLIISMAFRKDSQVLIIGILGISLVTGMLYANVYKNYFTKNTVVDFNNQKVILEGYISQPPDIKSNKTNLTLEGYFLFYLLFFCCSSCII